MASPSIWSSQPFKPFFNVWFWVVTVPYLFFLSQCSTITPLWAVPQWSYRVSMGAAILRAFFRYLAVLRFQQPRQMVPGKSKDRFVLTAPPNAALIRDVFNAPLAATDPAPVGAVWYPPIAYTAGGASVTGYNPDEGTRNLSAVATEHFGATHVLYMQYRLASHENPFPAAVQDMFTTYQYVLDLGIAPGDVVLMGDSAGGNLVLAVLRYLAQYKLPQPGT
ncbi:hypothetical protein PG999_007441 [Apiospora kogelbergensis]|uniref:Alpha/beta hydrolase fold-3 domain-containing protein n=1 Tax=Apiospora kogelbergensis TaxID=1337665 RepID=A0AAW0QYB9_9PEZI